MSAILDVLKIAGGTATSKEVYESLLRSGTARPLDIHTVQASGETRFAKEVRFARNELADSGLAFNAPDGSWSLSPAGWCTYLTPDDARELVRLRRHHHTNDLDGPRRFQAHPKKGPTFGPRPVGWEKIVSRKIAGEAWTYVLRFGNSDVWKIGFASDVDIRLDEINLHIPTEIIKQQWVHFARLRWTEALGAFDMEQRLLSVLQPYRTSGERVQCTEATLLQAWSSVCAKSIPDSNKLTPGSLDR